MADNDQVNEAEKQIDNGGFSDVAAAGTALAIGADCLERLASAFESSARRWELIIYPALFAFIVLAGYGFYLVYSLTSDVSHLARSFDRNMDILVVEMQEVSSTMQDLQTDLRSVSVNMGSVATNLQTVSDNVETLDPMLTNMSSIKDAMRQMTVSTHLIRGDMAHLNQNVGRPMSFMNSFMPW